MLLLLLEEAHGGLESALQFLLADLVAGTALLNRLLEIGELLLDRFQQFVHLQSVVLLQGRLLGCKLLCGGFLLFRGHALHLLSQAFEFLCPLRIALLAELGGILSLVSHLLFQVRQLLLVRLPESLKLFLIGFRERCDLFLL